MDVLRPTGRRALLPLAGGVALIAIAIIAAIHPPHIGTANLVFEGIVDGFNVSLLGMGIVLVYRSSRVINFAIGELGVPAAAVLGIMVGKSHWPYVPALLFALFVGTVSGLVVELFIIRRLFKAPRVIVLVATIGIAELAQAVTFALPDFHTGKLSTQFPNPITSETTLRRVGVHLDLGLFKLHTYVTNVTINGNDILTILVVSLIALFLWYLLGHTVFGESVRAAATNADLARLTGVSPKMMSTAVWTISGFLSAAAVILYATRSPSPDLVSVGNDTLLLGLTAALIGGMTSFPRTVLGAIGIEVLYRLLFFNFSGPSDSGLTSFVLFLLVLFLVARRSGDRDAGGESFSFAPRIPTIPERLREVWWVRRMPQLVAVLALVTAVVVPLVISQPSHHQTYARILAIAIGAVSVTVLTGWAGQLSLGQAAFAGLGGLSAASVAAGMHVNMGWKSHRLIQGSLRPVPTLLASAAILIGLILVATGLARPRGRTLWIGLGVVAFVGAGLAAVDILDKSVTTDPLSGLPAPVQHPFPMVGSLFAGAAISCLIAVAIGIGALRVKGLLLAISTMAFAITAQEYIFPRPILVGSSFSQNVSLTRGKLFFLDLTLHQRAFYYFTLALLVVVLILLGHLRRTGIGRMIVGVRENESGAAALTVSSTKAKLTAFAIAGFVAGLGGALIVGIDGVVGYENHYFLVDDSFKLVSMAVIGGLGSLAGAVLGALWVAGLPAFWPSNEEVPLLTSGIGLLIILLYFPGGFMQVAYWARAALFGWLEKRLPERKMKTTTATPQALTRVMTRPMTLNPDGGVLTTTALTVNFGGLTAVDNVDFRADAGEVIGLIGTNGAGKSTLLNAIGGYVASTGTVELLGRDVSKMAPHRRAVCGLGRTFQAATLFPELTVRETVQLALEAREPTPFWGSLLYWSYSKERRKRAEAAELIDFLGLGRYADRFIAELSTGTRRIVELTTVLAVAPRVICLDEPTAGVAQREAEAFGPLIKRVQQELDATLVVVEHDLPLILSISDRVYCLEAGAVIAEGSPTEIRNDPKVVASYLGTDERAIQRSNAPA